MTCGTEYSSTFLRTLLVSLVKMNIMEHLVLSRFLSPFFFILYFILKLSYAMAKRERERDEESLDAFPLFLFPFLLSIH